MKRSIYALVVMTTLVCSLTGFAQPDTIWSRTYNILARDVTILSLNDESFLIVSIGWNGTNYGGAVSKFSIAGDSLWSLSFEDGMYEGKCLSAAALVNGNILCLVDSVRGFGPLDNLHQRLYELSQDGETIRMQQLADTTWWSEIHAFPSGGFVLQGNVWWGNEQDLLVARFDANSDLMWATQYGDSETIESISHLDVDENGRSLFVGSFMEQGEFLFGTLIAVVDSSGQLLWDTVYQFDTYASGLRTSLWAADEIYTGGSWPEGDFLTHGWIVKLNAEGDSLWSRLIMPVDSATGMHVNDVATTRDGGIVGVGIVSGLGASFLFKMSSSGELIWQTCCSSAPFIHDYSGGILVLEDGGYLIAGIAYNDSFIQRVRLTRTAPDIVAVPPAGELPSSFVLHHNYPNPFNPTTEISFELPHAMSVALKVFDLLGREVAELANGNLSAGSHRVEFDGRELASGVYFYRLDAGEFSQTRKMVLMK